MVYINSSGNLQTQRSWTSTGPSEFFWNIVNFFSLFIETIWKSPQETLAKSGGPQPRRNNFGGGSAGGGNGGYVYI